jgi:hypothetical protein
MTDDMTGTSKEAGQSEKSAKRGKTGKGTVARTF